jgi:hypothetical protein
MVSVSDPVNDLLDSMMHQGILEKGQIIRVGDKEKQFDPSKFYIEVEGKNHQRTLRDPLKPLVLIRGPRGSGKSLAFSAAAQYINDGRRSSTSAALLLSCWNIGMRVRNISEAGSPGRSIIRLATLIATVLEISKSLQNIRLKRVKGKSIIDKLTQRQDKFLERVKAMAESAEAFLKGSALNEGNSDTLTESAALSLGRPDLVDLDIDSVYARVRTNHLDLAAEFLDMISDHGIENLYLFFDDYSEIDRDARTVMISALEAFFNAPGYQKKSLKFPVRVAIYWGDEFRTRLVGNVIVEEIGTDPYSANFCRNEQPGVVIDKKFGKHVRSILLARCQFFGLSMGTEFLQCQNERQSDEACAFLARISGGNMRILARYLKYLHNRDVPLSIDQLRGRCGRFFIAECDDMIRNSLQYYSGNDDVLDQHLKLCDWIKEETRNSGVGQCTSVIRARYLPLDNRCALKLKALVNAGIIYPVTDLYLRETFGGPTTLFAINEGLRLGWVGDVSTDFGDVTDAAFLTAFGRMEARLLNWRVNL